MRILNARAFASRTRTTLAAALVAALGCASTSYVWVDEMKDAQGRTRPQGSEYLIGPGDLLNVRVFNQEQMSARSRVRQDGKISLPFVNDVDASGITTTELARRIEGRLQTFINKPIVTVSLEEPGLIQISVLGEIARPGAYRVEPGSRILQVLATAGGLTQFADRDRIFVLRNGPDGKVARIRFTYDRLVHATGRAAGFELREGDVLVLE